MIVIVFCLVLDLICLGVLLFYYFFVRRGILYETANLKYPIPVVLNTSSRIVTLYQKVAFINKKKLDILSFLNYFEENKELQKFLRENFRSSLSEVKKGFVLKLLPNHTEFKFCYIVFKKRIRNQLYLNLSFLKKTDNSSFVNFQRRINFKQTHAEYAKEIKILLSNQPLNKTRALIGLEIENFNQVTNLAYLSQVRELGTVCYKIITNYFRARNTAVSWMNTTRFTLFSVNTNLKKIKKELIKITRLIQHHSLFKNHNLKLDWRLIVVFQQGEIDYKDLKNLELKLLFSEDLARKNEVKSFVYGSEYEKLYLEFLQKLGGLTRAMSTNNVEPLYRKCYWTNPGDKITFFGHRTWQIKLAKSLDVYDLNQVYDLVSDIGYQNHYFELLSGVIFHNTLQLNGLFPYVIVDVPLSAAPRIKTIIAKMPPEITKNLTEKYVFNFFDWKKYLWNEVLQVVSLFAELKIRFSFSKVDQDRNYHDLINCNPQYLFLDRDVSKKVTERQTTYFWTKSLVKSARKSQVFVGSFFIKNAEELSLAEELNIKIVAGSYFEPKLSL